MGIIKLRWALSEATRGCFLLASLQACTFYRPGAEDRDVMDGIRASADAQHYLRGCVWLLSMYICGAFRNGFAVCGLLCLGCVWLLSMYICGAFRSGFAVCGLLCLFPSGVAAHVHQWSVLFAWCCPFWRRCSGSKHL